MLTVKITFNSGWTKNISLDDSRDFRRVMNEALKNRWIVFDDCAINTDSIVAIEQILND